MRLTTSLLVAAATAAGISAQTPAQLELYSGSTSYTSRHVFGGANEGWVCMNLSSRHHRGVAGVDDPTGGSVGSVTAVQYLLQDQLGTTPEFYEVGIFGEDAANPGQIDPAVDPMTNRPAPGFQAGPIQTPANTATGPIAWSITLTFATPYTGTSMDQDNYFGVLLPIQTAWTADGASLHGSWMTAGAAGDNPSQGALTGGAMGGSVIYDMVQGIDITGGNTVVIAPNDRTVRVWPHTSGAVLRVGADIQPNPRSTINPNYGIAGLYPDHVNRQDGVAYDLRSLNYDSSNGGAAFVAMQFITAPMAPAFQTNGIKILAGAGQQWFDFTQNNGPFFVWQINPHPTDLNRWEQIVLAQGSVPAQALGTVTSQGLLVDFNAPGFAPTFTNATALESL